MARDAIYTLLNTDATLTALGGTGWVVLPNFSGDQRPNDAGGFMVIRWGTQDFEPAVLGVQGHRFDLWVHYPLALSTDYGRLDAILNRADAIFTTANDTTTIGADSKTLTHIDFEGRSGDLTDQGYQTIARRGSYRAFSY